MVFRTTSRARRPTNVFVLCTGRCGSVTFSRACAHLTNFTSGHESRTRLTGSDRLRYPQNHIEVDNRLAWYLGAIEESYGKNAFYVHLLRNPRDVAASYAKRWEHKHSLVRAFGAGISMKSGITPFEAATGLVETVNANIRFFLRNKPRRMTIRTETVTDEFPDFLAAIGAEGDHGAALAELSVHHNSSSATGTIKFSPDR